MITEPIHWSIQTLSRLTPHALHEIAVRANGTCTANNLHLGRCLMAVDKGELYLDFGCSGAVHYAISCLGMKGRRARELRRIATRLESLPLLNLAAEHGQIDYSKLREVLRRATPDTEADWLRLCQKMNYSKIERLVTNTPKGALPREEDARPVQPLWHQLRLMLGPDEMALVERGLQMKSREEGRLVGLVEALIEYFGGIVSQSRWGRVDVRRALREAALDVAAQSERAAQECPARDVDDWSLSVAADAVEVPDNEDVGVLKRAKAHWENTRLRFNPEARDLTPAQRIEVLRRDGYRCQCPGCPNHLWLETHHIVFYRDGGQTVPENLLVLCGACHRNLHRGYLRIEGSRAEGLRFLDRDGRDLAHQVELQRAIWLDGNLGWKGGEFDSHYYLARIGKKVGHDPLRHRTALSEGIPGPHGSAREGMC